MEALEDKLSEPLEADKSPDSHIRAHEVSHYCTTLEEWMHGGKKCAFSKVVNFHINQKRQ